MPGHSFIGTSGYSYKHWGDGVFYPAKMAQKNWLEYYAENFGSVELNVSFYRLPKEQVFEGWYNRTPANFAFAVKGSRFITHVKKLNDCQDSLDTFFHNASALREKLNIALWQLPPNLHVQISNLEKFCDLLAQNEISRKSRHTFEFRHQSWFCQEVYDLLKEFNYSLCIAHSTRWPAMEVITADYVYLRFHGGEALCGSNYSEEELRDWAQKARSWLDEDRDIYAYFNNDAYGFAVSNALRFRELLTT